jgi:hypothetical protein
MQSVVSASRDHRNSDFLTQSDYTVSGSPANAWRDGQSHHQTVLVQDVIPDSSDVPEKTVMTVYLRKLYHGIHQRQLLVWGVSS